MLTFCQPEDDRRSEVEAFIQSVYAKQYQARVDVFPRTLAYMFRDDEPGMIVCAAGLRDTVDGFFSEKYLDGAIEAVLGELVEQHVSRARIFEVSSLVSEDPHFITDFVAAIVAWGCHNHYQWCFFTVTRRLETLLKRMRLAPIHLCRADASRVPNLSSWGDYYLTEPRVVAVSHAVACESVASEV